MPFKIYTVTQSSLTRIDGKPCHLCGKPIDAEIGTVIVIKHTRKSCYGHPDCAIQKNWVDKSEIQKEYLLLESTPQ